jgi:DNA polymerase (family 10)
MPVHNPDIAQALDDLADLLELEEANPFRVRAYRNAARVVRGLGTEISAVLEKGGDLAELPGIGEDLADKIRTLAKTGHLPLLDRLRKETPVIAVELLKLPGLGPKRVKSLCHDLDIHNLEQLHRALLDGRVSALPGFGATTEAKLKQAIEARVAAPSRLKLALAESYVEPLLAWLRGAPGVDAVVAAGSYLSFTLRKQSTSNTLFAVLVKYPQVANPLLIRYDHAHNLFVRDCHPRQRPVLVFELQGDRIRGEKVLKCVIRHCLYQSPH